MKIIYYNFYELVCENKGFGINSDLLETNIFNLTIVIGCVIYYGKSLMQLLKLIWKKYYLKQLCTS